MYKTTTIKGAIAVLMALTVSACGSGGSLTLAGSPRKVASQGSPFVNLNLGGNAHMVELGKTPATGVHGWVTVQAVSSKSLTSADGSKVILNKTQAFSNH